jgi:hypothetical protein
VLDFGLIITFSLSLVSRISPEMAPFKAISPSFCAQLWAHLACICLHLTR